MNIHELMNNKGFTGYSLAKESGISYTTIKELLNGKRKVENLPGKTILALARSFYCSMEDVMNISFEDELTQSQSFKTKNDYYKHMLKNRKNVVLAKESAAEFLHLSNSNQNENIYVYSSGSLPRPFVVQKIENFNDLDYEIIDGLLVTDTNKTINDLLSNEETDPQSVYESLATYYFDHNESFDGLEIDEINEPRFEYFVDGAIKYYDEN